MKKRAMEISKLILCLLFVTRLEAQYVFTQLGELLDFGPQTPQVKTPVNLGSDFRATKQYTLWGWFRFKGFQESITNILNLGNNKEFSNNNTIIGPFPNPNFPACPVSQDDLENFSNVQNVPEIRDNPNCFP